MTYIHNISPVLLELGPLSIRWYSLMYIFGFVFAYLTYRKHVQAGLLKLTKDDLSDLIFYAFVGLLVGARLFYVLVYNLPYFLGNPFSIFEIWNGGLAFHGGFLGIIVALVLFLRKHQLPILPTSDLLILPVPFTLFMGRIGNFLNGELVGRVMPEDTPLCFIFPSVDQACRYPSQLIQAFGEGLLLYIIMMFAFYKTPLRKRPGSIFGIFFLGYGLFRFLAEYLREPDAQLGLYLDLFTMGQLLCIPMIAVGLYLLYHSFHVPKIAR